MKSNRLKIQASLLGAADVLGLSADVPVKTTNHRQRTQSQITNDASAATASQKGLACARGRQPSLLGAADILGMSSDLPNEHSPVGSLRQRQQMATALYVAMQLPQPSAPAESRTDGRLMDKFVNQSSGSDQC